MTNNTFFSDHICDPHAFYTARLWPWFSVKKNSFFLLSKLLQFKLYLHHCFQRNLSTEIIKFNKTKKRDFRHHFRGQSVDSTRIIQWLFNGKLYLHVNKSFQHFLSCVWWLTFSPMKTWNRSKMKCICWNITSISQSMINHWTLWNIWNLKSKQTYMCEKLIAQSTLFEFH